MMIPIIDMNALQYTNTRWPNNPFHIGEITLQQHEHMQDNVMSYAPKFIRPLMPNEHRQFFTELPFLVAAIRDPNTGYIWSTLLENIHWTTTNVDDNILVVTSPDPETLHIYGRPVPGDALEHVFDMNQYDTHENNNNIMIDVGLLGIQFETARRNRVNGRIILSPTTTNDRNTSSSNLPSPLLFKVDQSFGNCPQYIKARPQWHRVTETTKPTTTTNTLELSATGVVSKTTNHRLTPQQIQWIETAETFFTATGYRNNTDPNKQNVRYYGNDSSHRGGPPGFVKVIPNKNDDNDIIISHEIVWTEFNGNNHFNSLGNLLLDPHIGLCFPNFKNGGLLQITGTAIVEMGPLQFNQRQVRMTILAINEVVAGSLPIRWGTDSTIKGNNNNKKDETTWSNMRITNIVQESNNVKSFYIQPIDTSSSCLVQPFLGGQHLPIQLKINDFEVVERRYSISTSYKFNTLKNDNDKHYRISVKYHDKGKSSSFLHKHIKIGDTIKIGKPNGSFILNTKDIDPFSTSPIVLISAGIGITPILSMLYDLVAVQQNDTMSQRIIYWIHGARNQMEHPFQEELKDIHSRFLNPESLKIYTLYSKPVSDDSKDDMKEKNRISIGRITPQYIQQIVPDIQNASFYMCGPSSFLADMTTGLEDDIGIDNSNIFYETF
jgi:uncharacterized protein